MGGRPGPTIARAGSKSAGSGPKGEQMLRSLAIRLVLSPPAKDVVDWTPMGCDVLSLAMRAVRGAVARFFWSEERREREAPRRRDKGVRFDPVLGWLIVIALAVQVGLELIPEHHLLLRLLLRLPGAIVCVFLAGSLVWARHQRNLTPGGVGEAPVTPTVRLRRRAGSSADSSSE